MLCRRLTFLLTLLSCLHCAFGAHPEALVVSEVPSPAQLQHHLVYLQVWGGSPTFYFWKPQISDQTFDAALRESLRAAGVRMTDLDYRADRRLTARIWDLQQPIPGRNRTDWRFLIGNCLNYYNFAGLFDHDTTYTVEIHIAYSLTAGPRDTPIGHLFVRTKGTATADEAYFELKRMRLATERAAQANIREFTARMSELEQARSPIIP